jgi:hypothetical protein
MMTKYPCIEPEELFPGVFAPPMLLDFLDEAAAKQRFVENVDDICRDHEPEREDQGNLHTSTLACKQK